MKKLLLVAGILTVANTLIQSQELVPITVQSLNIPGTLEVSNWKNQNPNKGYPNYPVMFYGFAEGDEIHITFSSENKKGTYQIEVAEFTSRSVVYSNHQVQTTDNIKLKISQTSIYRIKFETNYIFARQCQVKISRIPASEQTKNFKCNVSWQTIADTTFTVIEEKRKIKSEYRAVTLQTPINHFVNSGRNSLFQGGKSRIAIPIILPENTIAWYYTFAATRDEKGVEKTKAGMKLFGELTKLIDETGTLSFGINALTQPPGANYCDIYLLKPEHWQAFLNKDENNWTYIPEGSRPNLMSGIVQVSNCCTNNTYYLGIKNPDPGYGIQVMIEIVAVTEQSTFETVQVKKPVSVSTKKIPILGS